MLCKIGLHDINWHDFQVWNMFGDGAAKCKRCLEYVEFDNEELSEGICHQSTENALRDIWLGNL